MAYKNFIWDFDGTLFDTYQGMTEALIAAAKTYQIQLEPDFTLGLLKVSMGHALKTLSQTYDLDPEVFHKKYVSEEIKRMPSGFPPFADTRQALEGLCNRGGRHFIMTHRDQTTVEILKHFRMDAYFDEVVIKEDGFPRKPAPDAFMHILTSHDLKLEETLVIGDRDLDLIGANKAHIDSCLIRDPFNQEAEKYATHVVANRLGVLLL